MMKKVFKGIGIVVALIVVAAAVFIAVLTITEYKPDAEEVVTINSSGKANEKIYKGSTFSVMSWNIGFAAQGADTDCFLDGGTMVIPTDEEGVNENLYAISETINAYNPSVVLLQEVDTDSKRSHYIDEYSYLQGQLPGYSNSFALNYSTLYVPYPFPVTYGKVNAGLATFTKFAKETSTRISLPCSFSWPMSTVNLKRCLLVDRIKIDGSEKELVIVNLHLEAYDDGEGKAAQTKQLCELIQSEYDKGNYVLAAGDFNQTFSNCDMSAYPTIDVPWHPPVVDVAEFGENFTLLMDNSVPTCRSLDKVYTGADHDASKFQYYMLDGVIVSKNITINELKTIDTEFEYSDHNPIIMSITLN